MSSYIRCPECSKCIGKYVEFIEKARQSLYEDKVFRKTSKFSKIDPEKLCFNPNVTPSLEKIFEAIDIKKICCRMHLSSGVRFENYS